MPGPAPKPEGQRRHRKPAPGTVFLPADGRQGQAPKWPMAGRPPKVWRELWALPQAAAWERLFMHRVVARYAAKLTEAEQPHSSSAILAEVRQLEDRLGLSPMAMLRLRWVISDPTATDAPAEVTKLDDYREAF